MRGKTIDIKYNNKTDKFVMNAGHGYGRHSKFNVETDRLIDAFDEFNQSMGYMQQYEQEHKDISRDNTI